MQLKKSTFLRNKQVIIFYGSVLENIHKSYKQTRNDNPAHKAFLASNANITADSSVAFLPRKRPKSYCFLRVSNYASIKHFGKKINTLPSNTLKHFVDFYYTNLPCKEPINQLSQRKFNDINSMAVTKIYQTLEGIEYNI